MRSLRLLWVRGLQLPAAKKEAAPGRQFQKPRSNYPIPLQTLSVAVFIPIAPLLLFIMVSWKLSSLLLLSLRALGAFAQIEVSSCSHDEP